MWRYVTCSRRHGGGQPTDWAADNTWIKTNTKSSSALINVRCPCLHGWTVSAYETPPPKILWKQALYTFPFTLREAPLDVSIGASFLNFTQAQGTLALDLHTMIEPLTQAVHLRLGTSTPTRLCIMLQVACTRAREMLCNAYEPREVLGQMLSQNQWMPPKVLFSTLCTYPATVLLRKWHLGFFAFHKLYAVWLYGIKPNCMMSIFTFSLILNWTILSKIINTYSNILMPRYESYSKASHLPLYKLASQLLLQSSRILPF